MKDKELKPVVTDPLPYNPNIGTDGTDYKSLYNRAKFIAQYLVTVDALSIEDAENMFYSSEFDDITTDEFICRIADSKYIV